jgi:putative addiction module component (TIGR02574 family)
MLTLPDDFRYLESASPWLSELSGRRAVVPSDRPDRIQQLSDDRMALTVLERTCYSLQDLSRGRLPMSTNLSQDLLNDAMRLPDEQRAALAAALIESLDESVDEDAEAAWSGEIARRLQQIQRGEVTTIPWPQARRMIVANERPDV